ncbi:MAG: copper chaperone PCu(A)C [Anderseniella sp.]|nr:copper chaperone PCu(A)C [Anderseniella sp.]
MFRVTRTLVCIFFSTISLPQAIADDVRNDDHTVSVEAANVPATKAGGTARLQFKIINHGNEPVNLRSVRSDLAKGTRMTIFDPFLGRRAIDDLSVLRDETLDLDTSHIRVELVSLTEDMEPGTTIEFELVFRRFSTTAEAHVH